MSDIDEQMRRLASDAVADQLLVTYIRMAEMIGAYYIGLIKSGVPSDLAALLTTQMQQMVMLQGRT